MENCLLRSLKKNVNNEDLRVIGEFRTADAVSQAKGYMVIGLAENTTIKLSSPTALMDIEGVESAVNEVVLSGTRTIYVNAASPVPFYYRVYPKYNMTELFTVIENMPLDEFADLYADGFYKLDLNKAVGDVKNLSGLAALSYLKLNNAQKVSGDLSAFSELSQLSYCHIISGGVSGNLSSLSSLRGLTDVELYDMPGISGNINAVASCIGLTKLLLAPTSVIGTIESFAEAQIAAGRTSGSVQVNATHVTYNGIELNNHSKIITYSNGSYTVTDGD